MPQTPTEAPLPPGWRFGPPDFVGVGVQKAGTTWWYSLVVDHPGVQPAPEKELHFFDGFWQRDFGDTDRDAYYRCFPRPPGAITGEWTPRYMYDPWTPPLLAGVAPEAKILVLLRDPVERYLSGLSFERTGMHREIDLPRVHDHVARSCYRPQLQRLQRFFPRASLLVLQYERCVQDPQAWLDRTYAFLGLLPFVHPDLDARVNDVGRVPLALPRHLRETLGELLCHEVEALANEFPTIDPALWLGTNDLRS